MSTTTRFVMPRGTQRHIPSRPGAHPRPVPDAGRGSALKSFWKAEERRRAAKRPGAKPADREH